MSYTVGNSRRRYVAIHADMSPEEHKALKTLAKAQERSVSWLSGRVLNDYVRRCTQAMEVPTEVVSDAQ